MLTPLSAQQPLGNANRQGQRRVQGRNDVKVRQRARARNAAAGGDAPEPARRGSLADRIRTLATPKTAAVVDARLDAAFRRGDSDDSDSDDDVPEPPEERPWDATAVTRVIFAASECRLLEGRSNPLHAAPPRARAG